MTIPGIWKKDEDDWKLSRPEGFPDEATLHRLILGDAGYAAACRRAEARNAG